MYPRGVRTAPVDEVVASIRAHASREPGGAVAFDGDGTLWSGDVGEDFFGALLESRRFADAVAEPLVHEARAEGIDASGGAAEVARRIHQAYLAGTFPEERVCEIMTWAFAGWPRAEMEALAEQVVASVDLRARLHDEALAVVAWAKEEGIRVCLVSASPRAIVHAAARLVGVDLANVASATEHRSEGDIVLPSVERPIPYGAGKVAALRTMLGDRPLYAAFGDNAFDVPMLREARVPVAIRPKPRLAERASEVPGIVVLERR